MQDSTMICCFSNPSELQAGGLFHLAMDHNFRSTGPNPWNLVLDGYLDVHIHRSRLYMAEYINPKPRLVPIQWDCFPRTFLFGGSQFSIVQPFKVMFVVYHCVARI